jgi:hypothetical protein
MAEDVFDFLFTDTMAVDMRLSGFRVQIEANMHALPYDSAVDIGDLIVIPAVAHFLLPCLWLDLDPS